MILFLSWMAIIAGVLFVFVGMQNCIGRHRDHRAGILFMMLGVIVGLPGLGGVLA